MMLLQAGVEARYIEGLPDTAFYGNSAATAWESVWQLAPYASRVLRRPRQSRQRDCSWSKGRMIPFHSYAGRTHCTIIELNQ